jgi:hypothetical protein
MPKRGSTATGAAAAAKKAKTAEGETSAVGNWVQSKTGDKELDTAEKNGLLRHDPAETLAVGPEIIPRLPRLPGNVHCLHSSGVIISSSSFPLWPSLCLWDSTS